MTSIPEFSEQAPSGPSKSRSKSKGKRRLVTSLRKRMHLLNLLIVTCGVVILLLLFLLGFATDWTRGLRRASTTNGLTPGVSDASALSNTPASGATAQTGTANTGGSTSSNTKTTTTTGGNSSTAGKGANTTTNNTTTTTNNNTTTTTNPSSPGELAQFYEATGAGQDIDQVKATADQLGITPDCQNELLVQVCSFSVDGSSVTTKNLLGTGLVTSVTKNF